MTCSCGNISENKDTGDCPQCGRAKRKAEADSLKIKKTYNIKKVSDKRASELTQYSKDKAKFLLVRWCALHGKPCLPIDIHHSAGKIGYIDDWARNKGITAFLDIRYWVPVCRVAHEEIELNPNWAKENGFSESRLSKK